MPCALEARDRYYLSQPGKCFAPGLPMASRPANERSCCACVADDVCIQANEVVSDISSELVQSVWGSDDAQILKGMVESLRGAKLLDCFARAALSQFIKDAELAIQQVGEPRTKLPVLMAHNSPTRACAIMLCSL
jgi:hypothetical protein